MAALQAVSAVLFVGSSRKRKSFKERVNVNFKTSAEIKCGGRTGSAKAVPYFLILSIAKQPISSPGSRIVEFSRSHTIRHTHTHTHTVGRTPLSERSARHTGRYLNETQQTENTDIHSPSGIRTCDPAIERLKSYALNRMATGIDAHKTSAIILLNA